MALHQSKRRINTHPLCQDATSLPQAACRTAKAALSPQPRKLAGRLVPAAGRGLRRQTRTCWDRQNQAGLGRSHPFFRQMVALARTNSASLRTEGLSLPGSGRGNGQHGKQWCVRELSVRFGLSGRGGG